MCTNIFLCAKSKIISTMIHLKVDKMFDTERFIKEVRSRTILWQNSSKLNKVRLQKRQEWTKLAEVITPNWSDFSEMKKNEIVDELQKKWRNLRDYHFRTIKHNKVNINRKAPYLNMLHFLEKREPDKLSTLLNENKVCLDTGDDIDEDDEVMSIISQPVGVSSYNTHITDDSESEALPFINAHSTSYNEDPDRSFLISLLPHIKTLDEGQKFKFKLNTMKLLEKIKYSASECSNKNEVTKSQTIKEEITEDDYDPFGINQEKNQENDTNQSS